MSHLFRIFTVSFFFLLVYLIIHLLLVFFDQRSFATLANLRQKSKFESGSNKYDNLYPGNTLDNIFWFVQVTDIHLSKFSDRGRTPDLYEFCKYTIPLLRPEFVLASGDLTDAKSPSQQDSTQYIEEWQAYKSVLEDSGVLRITTWFDIRGNHDTFNVPHLQHKDNFFREYSVQGKNNLQSYYFQHKKKFGTYSFIGLDANPNPGPKRPYNFHGVISTSNAHMLQHFSRESAGANMTVWFGHHPTSTIVSLNMDLRQLIGQNGVAYLCGHLHTWHGMAPRMHALQPQGFLELELGDWRDCRIYRVLAIDHDIFSFVDSRHNQWPLILITNPKDARYLLPSKEMVHRISHSTHIRILVWSPGAIKEVLVFINGKQIGEAKRVKSDQPLFVLPWQPKLYSHNSHNTITVAVKDVEGRFREVSQIFTTNGTPSWEFDYLSGLLLLSYQPHNVQFLYYSLWFTLLGVILIMRLVKYKANLLRGYLDHSVVVSLYRFANHDRLFYPLIIYLLYTAIGPIMIGTVIEGHWAIVFLYGIKVSNTFIPEYFPYVSEFIQNLTFVLPLCLYLLRRIHQNDMHAPSRSWLHFCWHRFGYVSLLVWQTFYWFFSVYLPYGALAAILSPCRLWLIPMSYFMLRSVASCPKLDAAFVLSVKRRPSTTVFTTSANNEEENICEEFALNFNAENGLEENKNNKEGLLHSDKSYADLLVQERSFHSLDEGCMSESNDESFSSRIFHNKVQ